MTSKETKLSWVNDLNRYHGGQPISLNIDGYRNQWLMGAFLASGNALCMRFAQGKKIGRITAPCGYERVVSLEGCKSYEDMWHRIDLLDPKNREAWEKQQPEYIKAERTRKLLNKKIASTKRRLTNKIGKGKALPKKDVEFLKKHGAYTAWEEQCKATLAEKMLRTAKKLRDK